MSSDPNNEFEMTPAYGRLNENTVGESNISQKESLLVEEYDGKNNGTNKGQEIKNYTMWGVLRLNPGVSAYTIITFFST